MNPLIGALVLILLGVLGGRLSFRASDAPLGPRLILSAGTHFLFLGFVLGSQGVGLLTRSVIEQLYPALALGLGWIGLLFGLQLERRQLVRFPVIFLWITVAQAVLAFLVFLGVGLLLLHGLGAWTPLARGAIMAAAATACISTPAGIALISQSFRLRGEVSKLIFFIASLDAVVGILALQVTAGLYHPTDWAGAGLRLSVWAWAGIAAALGVVFGIFFLWLTRPKPSPEELPLFLLGLVVFSAGAALHLGVSPLFVSGITGAVIANFSPLRRRIFTSLQEWEKPVYVILLILAGALLDFRTWLVVPLAVAYVLVRAGAKVAAGFAATRVLRPGFATPPDLGVGLIPQGGISLAMAVAVTLAYGSLDMGPADPVDLLFSTVVLGVLLSELAGPVLIDRLLRRAGEIETTDVPEPERA